MTVSKTKLGDDQRAALALLRKDCERGFIAVNTLVGESEAELRRQLDEQREALALLRKDCEHGFLAVNTLIGGLQHQLTLWQIFRPSGPEPEKPPRRKKKGNK